MRGRGWGWLSLPQLPLQPVLLKQMAGCLKLWSVEVISHGASNKLPVFFRGLLFVFAILEFRRERKSFNVFFLIWEIVCVCVCACEGVSAKASLIDLSVDMLTSRVMFPRSGTYGCTSSDLSSRNWIFMSNVFPSQVLRKHTTHPPHPFACGTDRALSVLNLIYMRRCIFYLHFIRVECHE